jgi:hypothetical protein
VSPCVSGLPTGYHRSAASAPIGSRDSPHLYPDLRAVVNGLLEITDVKNVARQINQLVVRTAEGS